MSVTEEDFLSRSAALLGSRGMARLAAAHVLVVGVGGVGSWCAEALVRTGVGQVTLRDDDVVSPSNVNRQAMAQADTLARPKTEAMCARLKAIRPQVSCVSDTRRFESAEELGAYDVVVDAIDSVACKAELILAASQAALPLFSSMGAALRFDPTRVRVTRFDKVVGDGLAKALRQRFKRLGRFPTQPFRCVWSDETPAKCETRGSLMPVTATFGLCLAAEVIRELIQGRE